MPQLYIRDINLQNMESLQSLEYSRNLHKDLRVVVIDKYNDVHFGELERVLSLEERGNTKKDLVVRTYDSTPRYLRNDEIVALAIFFQIGDN